MGNIHDLEKIQKRATKLIPSLQHLSYLERHQHLNLPSLLYRRTHMDLMMTYKILHGLVHKILCDIYMTVFTVYVCTYIVFLDLLHF